MSETLRERVVWVVWRNTDLTEGRGQEVPFHRCPCVLRGCER